MSGTIGISAGDDDVTNFMRDRPGPLRTWIRLMSSELRQHVPKVSLLHTDTT